MTKLTFKGYDCEVKISTYQNKQIRIDLVAADTVDPETTDLFPGMPISLVTVGLPNYKFKESETALHDYSENEGILDALVAANVVRDTGVRVVTGYVTTPIVEVIL
ncbi:hypothetical protein [Vibrio sp. 1180_3]|uniref:hypothetical protein n=1 Tax=Vibrio sp. 1180_3 TaxID=2528832 RepID=UPI002405E7F7|nr:hypothetical protein [Vibrio sp. 1180_3]MDF9399081.1 hypothetical protein [Vibrio sp. 1180_3]